MAEVPDLICCENLINCLADSQLYVNLGLAPKILMNYPINFSWNTLKSD